MSENVYNNELGFQPPEEHLPRVEQLDRLANGDATVVNELVAALTQYTVDVVTWYVRGNPTAYPYREDLIAESLLELVSVLNSLLGRSFTAPQLLNYVKRSLEGSCVDWLAKVNTVTIPQKTADRTGQVLQRHDLREDHKVATEDEMFGEFEFDDFVEHTFSDLEQQVVRLLIQGHSVTKIREILDLPEAKAKNLVELVRDRFRKGQE